MHTRVLLKNSGRLQIGNIDGRPTVRVVLLASRGQIFKAKRPTADDDFLGRMGRRWSAQRSAESGGDDG